MSEPARIQDQLQRAFDGNAWHGPSLIALLKDVEAAQAAAKPTSGLHSIWELVLHIIAWERVVVRRLGGETIVLPGRTREATTDGTLSLEPPFLRFAVLRSSSRR